MYNWKESIEELYLAKHQYSNTTDIKERTRLLHKIDKLCELISKRYEESL